MSLAKCPKCGHRRFDMWAWACERRQCGLFAVGSCDWGGCGKETVALRFLPDDGSGKPGWLSVCRSHNARAVQTFLLVAS